MKTISFEFGEGGNTQFPEGSPFRITEDTPPLSVLFRVLAGTCEVTSKVSSESEKLTRNYFKSDFQENSSRNLDFLDAFEEGIKLVDYEEHIKKNKYANIKFYQSLLSEVAGCVFNEHKGKHTVAFVHLYRAYEYISYAFPMIYASRTTDYVGTFQNLRDWMNDKGEGAMGELKFLRKFIQTIYKDDPMLKSHIVIDVKIEDGNVNEDDGGFDGFKKIIFDSLAKKVMGWNSADSYSIGTAYPDKLSIPFEEYHSFIINLRNRFFHYFNQRSDNLGINDVIDSDLLFSMVNKASLYYITTLFHEISKPGEVH